MKYIPIQINQEWHLRESNPLPEKIKEGTISDFPIWNPAYDQFEKEAIANAKPIINHDGREWYESKDLEPIEQYYNDVRGINSCWMEIPDWMRKHDKSDWKDYKTRQAWKYIGEKPVEKLTEQQILQQPKELFMDQQLRNNMPEGYKAAKLIDLFSYMFRIGFENGMNWQKEQENTAERTNIIGIIEAEKSKLICQFLDDLSKRNLYNYLLTKINNNGN